jgi:hypothetical protein
VLLALRERAVGGERLAVLEPNHGRGARGVQAPGEDPRTGRLEFVVQGVDVPHHLLQDLGGENLHRGCITLSRYCFISGVPPFCSQHRARLLTL